MEEYGKGIIKARESRSDRQQETQERANCSRGTEEGDWIKGHRGLAPEK